MINNYLGTCSEVFISPQAVDLFCFLISYSKTKFTCLKFTLELDNYLNTADSTMLTSRTVTATSAEHAQTPHASGLQESFSFQSSKSLCTLSLLPRENGRDCNSSRKAQILKSSQSSEIPLQYLHISKAFFYRTGIYEHGDFTQPWLREELFAHTNVTPSHHYKGK